MDLIWWSWNKKQSADFFVGFLNILLVLLEAPFQKHSVQKTCCHIHGFFQLQKLSDVFFVFDPTFLTLDCLFLRVQSFVAAWMLL